ncbi:MAG: hypothetical protein K2X81_05590, partial [Candidatus Obscuribacterales bacterium]|nr:hypothetical protein [Candidatus Obscuribacterales bacterium]
YTPTAILKKYPQYLRRFRPGDIAILNLDPTNSGDEMLAIVAKNAPWIPYLIFKDTSALTAKCIPSLNAFYDLRVVEASNSTISGDILAQANCWAKLEQLHWARAVNPGPLLRKLQSSPLRVLRLEDSHLSHQDFVLISKLSGLQKLVLSGTKVTAEDCKTLSKLKNLPPVKPQE